MTAEQVTFRQALMRGAECLAQAGVPEAEDNARQLFEAAFGLDRTHFFLKQEEAAPEAALASYEVLLSRRAEHIPLQYLLGSCWFCGLEFQVDERVLIPRFDTEVLVEEVLKEMRELPAGTKIRMLDLCAGSGCIGIAAARHLGNRGLSVELTEADLSADALAVTEANAKRLGVACTCIRSDLFEELKGRTYDLIVSNPPYIGTAQIAGLMPEVRDFEPRMALDGGTDGLDFYRRIARESGSFLTEGGWLFLEIGYDQGETVPHLLEEAGFREVSVGKDLAGNARVVRGKKGGGNSDV